MAADVRNPVNSDFVNDPSSFQLSPEIESCSIPFSSQESDISSGSSTASLPSYIIVQRQMQDVAQAQKVAVERLVRHNIEVLNESKASFDMVVTSQEQKIKMLEKTIMEDYVPKEMHDSLRTEMKEAYVPKENLEILKTRLEQEYERHNQTRAKLQDVLDKLETSLSQTTTLTKQMEDDKLAFDSACESLRQEISETQARNRNLESRLTEKTIICEQQQCQIAQLREELEALQKKQQSQAMRYKHMAMEANVERQQEVYLSQIFTGRNKKI